MKKALRRMRIGVPTGLSLHKKFDSLCKEGGYGCWLFLGALDGNGYGQIGVNGKRVRAHRLSWTLHRGEIPPNLYVLHHCDRPPCVNPQHLFLGTAKDNSQDMIKKGRGRKAAPPIHSKDPYEIELRKLLRKKRKKIDKDSLRTEVEIREYLKEIERKENNE